LEIIQQNGIEPEIIKYLETPPSISELQQLLKLLNLKAEDIMRKGEEDYKQHIKNKGLSESEKLDLMLKYPKIIERPIVFNDKKAVIGRPPENVLTLL
jgi:arsenate reductase